MRLPAAALGALAALSISCTSRSQATPEAAAGMSTRGDAAVHGTTPGIRSGGSMIPVLPDSPSIVLRSSHILRIAVEAAAVGAWTPDSPGLNRRTVDLTLRAVEVLKGDVGVAPGARFAVRVQQFAWSTRRTPDALPGLWSSASTDVGTELLAFASSSLTAPEALVVEPACHTLLPAPQGLADVKLAANAESRHQGLTELLGEARRAAPSLGWIFPEYLWARYRARAADDHAALDEILGLLEYPPLSPDARYALLDRVVSAAGDEHATPAVIDRTALALAQLLATPEAAALHDGIIETHLPNVLGLAGGAARRSAGNVFDGHPDDRGRFSRALQARASAPAAARLLSWLAR
jgi:hypothetical protein